MSTPKPTSPFVYALLVTTTLSLLLAACRPATPAGLPTPTSGVAAQAQPTVAPDAQPAGQAPANDTTATPDAAAPAQQPEAPPTPVPSNLPQSVNINAAALSDKVAAITLPAQNGDPGAPNMGGAMPSHVRISFGGEQLTTDFVDPNQRQILIIPVQDYLDRFAADADMQKQAQSRIDALQALIKARTTKASDEIPVVPAFNAAQVFRSKVKYINFKGGSGVRFVTTYAQDVMPITNSDVFYTFQGLTNDGKYYVAAYIPVDTKVLTESRDKVQQKELDETVKDFDAYLKRVTTALERQPSNGYTPNLDSVDNVVKSIELKTADSAAQAGDQPAQATDAVTATVAPGTDPGVAVIDPKPAGVDATSPTTDTAQAPAQPAQGAAGEAQVGRTNATDGLNVRATPSSRGARLGQLRHRARVEVLGRNQNSDWLQIRYRNRTGWVSAEFIVGIDVNTLPLVD
jgi:uncharacterized protein YgiM (DUF1202 family)